MPRPLVSHSTCDHADTRYDRELCRLAARHANCNHPQDAASQRGCEDMAKNHGECTHGTSPSERKACSFRRTQKAKRAAFLGDES